MHKATALTSSTALRGHLVELAADIDFGHGGGRPEKVRTKVVGALAWAVGALGKGMKHSNPRWGVWQLLWEG